MPSPATHANTLARETSPYLLQHAHNPVDWHAWGPEAFALARRLNRPVFLSVGYSTCYWCHVMERQCFENQDIAALMNELFVNIKVDREERPDVDELYMTAVQMMTGRGGWPMSVFLTPPRPVLAPGTSPASGQQPGEGTQSAGLARLYAGTYFPPEPQHGIPSFPQVLQAIAQAWRDRREEVLEQAATIAQALRQHLSRPSAAGAAGAALGPQTVQRAANNLARGYDLDHGGFGGSGGPKFPQASVLLFLLKIHRNNPNADLWEPLAFTLRRMACGGIFDQIGGGFHRYSTDGQWLVPHFEKMLYDNAQLIETYLVAQSIETPAADPDFYRRVVVQTCDYVLREMTDSASGAFWSAQDAEVDGREGANYLWTSAEVTEAISDAKLSALAVAMYGLDGGTNFVDPHHPDAGRTNVLYLPLPLDKLARKQQMTLPELLQAKAEIDQRMLAVRQTRKQPCTDDKVLASWNGLMIGALAQAGKTLGEPRYTEAAARAARFILTSMRQPGGSGQPAGLYRTLRLGQAKVPAFLEDYAFLIHGLIELHRSTDDPNWLRDAEQLAAVVERDFAPRGGGGENGRGGGGYFDTRADQVDLLVRTRSFHDGAIPSGNSQMVHDLIDLFQATENDDYFDRAVRALESSAQLLNEQGQTLPHLEHALLRALEIDPHCFSRAARPATLPREQTATPAPVTARVEPEELTLVSGSASARVILTIAPGFHLNAHDPGLPELIPTSLTLRGTPGWELAVDYPPGETRSFAMADQPIRVYEGHVEISVQIRPPAASPPDAQPVLVLRFQPCTDRECMPPTELELPLKVVQPPA